MKIIHKSNQRAKRRGLDFNEHGIELKFKGDRLSRIEREERALCLKVEYRMFP
jgi:hypothetical protein